MIKNKKLKITYILFIIILLIFVLFSFIPIKEFEIYDLDSGEVIISAYVFLYSVLNFYLIPFVFFYFLNINIIIFSLSKYSYSLNNKKLLLINILFLIISMFLFILSFVLANKSSLMQM